MIHSAVCWYAECCNAERCYAECCGTLDHHFEVLIHVMIQRRREILDSWLYFLLENINHM